MKKQALACTMAVLFMFAFSGCVTADDKTANLSTVYAITAVIAVVVLICYCLFAKKKDIWYTLLFSSVAVINVGYLWLSVSTELSWALMANRLSYLGSVFLPFSMFMIIMNTVQIKCKRWVIMLLLGIGCVVFLIAASPGYLDIYYKEVYLETVNGFSTLKKVYGPLHGLTLIYLVGYFGTMVYTIFYAQKKKSIENKAYTAILTMAVFVNIGLWFIEQLVRIDFEVLSVSYIISELFLLGLNILIAEHNTPTEPSKDPVSPTAPTPVAKVTVSEERLMVFCTGLAELTKTEKLIYDAYVEGKSTKEIMEQLSIKENTLKFHNKNIYSKLGVSSRKQLVEISKAL